jgi:thiol-disulfide isomerase/thioredoxin
MLWKEARGPIRWPLGTAVLALALGAGQARAQGDAGIAVGSKAPLVAVNDLDGKPVNLGTWIGKRPVLLEFWATWCENCEALLPSLKAAYQAYSDRMEFIAVNVVVNQTPEKVRRYITQHELPFRILYDDQATSVRAYLAPATSFVVLIGKDGKVTYTGLGPDQKLEPAIKKTLGAP